MKRFLLLLLCSLGWVLHGAQQPVQVQLRTVADLSAFVVTTSQTNLTALVNGGTLLGDSDWGHWYFCPGDTTTVDGTTVIASTGVSGRWRKMNGYIVTAYGFSSSDTAGTANAAAITNAINAGYRSLEFPSGSYYVASLGVVTNDYELIGDKKGEGSPTVFAAPDITTTFTTLTNASVILKNITFDGYQYGVYEPFYASGTNYVVTNTVANITMKDCVWTNILASALYSYHGGNGLLYESSMTKLLRADIDGCKFYPDNVATGIAWQGKPFTDFNINNCEFIGGSIGVVLGVDDVDSTMLNPGTQHRGYRITKNKFYGQDTYGCQLMGGGGIVADNIFEAIYDSDPYAATMGIYAFSDKTLYSRNQFIDCGSATNGASMYVKGTGIVNQNNAAGYGNVISGNSFRLITNTVGGSLVCSLGNTVVNNTFDRVRGYDNLYPSLVMFTDYTNRVMCNGSIVGNQFYGQTESSSGNQSAVIELKASGTSSCLTNILIQGNSFFNIRPASSAGNAIHVVMDNDATQILDGLRVYDNQFNPAYTVGGGVTWGGIYFNCGASAVVKNVVLDRNSFQGSAAFATIPAGVTVAGLYVKDNFGPNTVAWVTNSGTISGIYKQLNNQADTWFPGTFSGSATPESSITASPGSLAQVGDGTVWIKRAGTAAINWGRLVSHEKIPPLVCVTNVILTSNQKTFDGSTNDWSINSTNWVINDVGWLSKAHSFGAGQLNLIKSAMTGKTNVAIWDIDSISGGNFNLTIGLANTEKNFLTAAGTYIAAATAGSATTVLRLEAGPSSVCTIDNVDVLGLLYRYTVPTTVFATGSAILGLDFEVVGHSAANGNNKRIYVFASDSNTRVLLYDTGVITDNAKVWKLRGKVLRGSDNTTNHKADIECLTGGTSIATTFTTFSDVSFNTAWQLWVCCDVTAAGDLEVDDGKIEWIRQ